MERARPKASIELARHDQPIAAVFPLAAQHSDAMFGQRCEPLDQKLHHAVPGILHQDDAGNPHFDGAPVDLAHFGSGQDGMDGRRLHMRRATTIVMSSCNSEAPVHWFTASMARAIISDESALEYFIT